MTGVVFYSTAMQGLASLQPTPVGYVSHSTGKLGVYNANWDTGELSFRSPTFLQKIETMQLNEETGAYQVWKENNELE